MTEKQTEKTFEPITTQEEFDEIIKGRLAREREKWEKRSSESEGSAEGPLPSEALEGLKAQLEAKDRELASMAEEAAIDGELARRGITDATRQARIKRLVDGAGAEPVEDQLAALSKDVPELFKVPKGAGSGGSKTPVASLETEKPLTRDEVENMGPDDINSRWDAVKAFLAGERA